MDDDVPIGQTLGVIVRRWLVGRDDYIDELMNPLEATDAILFDERNGVEFSRSSILWSRSAFPDVYGSSGGGFAAEWHLLDRE